MLNASVLRISLVLVVCGLVVTALPASRRTSPVYYVEVQPAEYVRSARSAANSYPREARTPGGMSNVKSDFYRQIRGARLHVADGAYPVYYTPGVANGRFGAKIFTLT